MPSCSHPPAHDNASLGSGGAGGLASGASGSTGSAGTGGSSSTAGSGGSSGSGGTRGPDQPVPPIGTECNDLVVDVPDYMIVGADGSPAAATGGVIADGTYYLLVQRLYGLSTSLALDAGSVKLVIAGDSWQEVDGVPPDEVDVNPVVHATASFSVNGTSFTLTQTCPDGSSALNATLKFSGDSTGFTMYGVDHGYDWDAVFMRR